ncbi:MAG TPA: VOC family protein [Bryobacteraceae bacterium]|nr:VOC family protein [Bryobacteraceae bacterium]
MPHIDRHTPGSFCWIELATTDQNAAKQFYTSLFGWSVSDFPMGPDESYSTFRLDGRDAGAAYTMRSEQRQQGIPPHWMLYVATTSADETARKAGEASGRLLAPPFDVFDFGRMAVLQDPAGAVISVWQAGKHAGLGIKGVDHTFVWADLVTPDRETAVRFYSAVFGWYFEAGEKDAASEYLHVRNGQEYIGGVLPKSYQRPGVPPHWLLYFGSSDCDRDAATATELGASLHLEPITIPNVGRMAIIADPQGAVFSVFQPARREDH